MTPSHQYPLGHRMTVEDRHAALAWSQATGAVLVEDDYDGEFRFDIPPVSSMAGMRPDARVAYVGTMSKVLDPGLRLAYLRVPPALLPDVLLPSRSGLLAGDPALPAWLARAALAAGDTDLAARVADAAAALAKAHPGHPALTAAAAHCQGIARQDPARLSEAARRHPDAWARASAAEDLGVLHRVRGHCDQSVHDLKEALAGYHESQADRDQARVRRRLRKLGVRHRHWNTSTVRPLTGWDSLSEAEQAVARLVAQGLNNKQVGARIYISEHTVAYHLRQAFRKLSITSRVELTRIAIEQTADEA